jgi:hypothetical protein
VSQPYAVVAWKHPQGVVRIITRHGTYHEAERTAAAAHRHFYGDAKPYEGGPRFLPMAASKIPPIRTSKPRRRPVYTGRRVR